MAYPSSGWLSPYHLMLLLQPFADILARGGASTGLLGKSAAPQGWDFGSDPGSHYNGIGPSGSPLPQVAPNIDNNMYMPNSPGILNAPFYNPQQGLPI